MRRHLGLLLLLGSCRQGGQLPPELSGAGLARPPRVLTHAAAVLFWLPATDTLTADSLGQAIGHMAQAASDLRGVLRGTDIDQVLTTGTRVWVQAAGAPRRVISLAGLDYPYGVVLVEPGFVEQILTGPVSDLRDYAMEYFGIDFPGEGKPIAGNHHCRLPSADCRGQRAAEQPSMSFSGFSFLLPSEMGDGHSALAVPYRRRFQK